VAQRNAKNHDFNSSTISVGAASDFRSDLRMILTDFVTGAEIATSIKYMPRI
jgi:hypothetical protein